MNLEILEEYKKLSKPIKDNLHFLNAINECYDCNPNFSDDMVIAILELANKCWLEDEYSKASIADYANYISNGVIDNDIKIVQLNKLYDADIVEAYNNESTFEDLLNFDVSKYDFAFNTNDGKKYYLNNDEMVVLNEKGRLVSISTPMDNLMEDIFDLLKNNKIDYITLSMHYNIRCMIKNDILPDSELKERYKKGIENYQNYCEERFITSNDILKVVHLDTDIKLFDIDNIYTEQNKLARLKKYNGNKYDNYSYVASLTNGTDYYYKNGKYVALNKNNITKEFDATKDFLLNELRKKYKFIYICDKEAKNIANSIEQKFENSRKNKFYQNLYSVREFLNFENYKEQTYFKNDATKTKISLFCFFEESYREYKEQSKMSKKNLKKEKDIIKI